MSKEPKTLDELMAEYEPERLAELERQNAEYDSLQAVAAREARRKAEFELGVREGWWDKDGEPIPQPSDDDETDDETDE